MQSRPSPGTTLHERQAKTRPTATVPARYRPQRVRHAGTECRARHTHKRASAPRAPSHAGSEQGTQSGHHRRTKQQKSNARQSAKQPHRGGTGRKRPSACAEHTKKGERGAGTPPTRGEQEAQSARTPPTSEQAPTTRARECEREGNAEEQRRVAKTYAERPGHPRRYRH